MRTRISSRRDATLVAGGFSPRWTVRQKQIEKYPFPSPPQRQRRWREKEKGLERYRERYVFLPAVETAGYKEFRPFGTGGLTSAVAIAAYQRLFCRPSGASPPAGYNEFRPFGTERRWLIRRQISFVVLNIKLFEHTNKLFSPTFSSVMFFLILDVV